MPFFLDRFALTNTTFGTMYSIATLASAASLPYLGGWIDRTSLKRYGLSVATGLAIASTTIALSYHVAVLFIGIYLLRLTGQGLSSHTARTAMARRYSGGRGKALSLANLGYPIGEGLLPLLITALLSYVSWRTAWFGIGGIIGLLFIPFLMLVLDSSFDRLKTGTDHDAEEEDANENPVVKTTGYRTLLTEPRFWYLAPAVVLPGFWATGLFLYQVQIARQLHWTKELMATAFTAFAAGRVLFSLLAGPAIDRWSATRLFPLYLLPLGGGLLAAYFHPGKWAAFVYMGLLGMTLGAGGNLKSSLFAELYGTNILGTVRSLYSSLSVFGTALCPFLMGWLMDYDVAITDILAAALISVLVASCLAYSHLYRIKIEGESEP